MSESQRVELRWEQCRLLTPARFGTRYLSETVRGPKFQKLRNRRRAVTLKMIVGISIDEHAALHDLVAVIDPTTEFAAIIISPLAKSGYKSIAFYQHQSVLRLALEGLGVTKLPGDAAAAPAMWEFFSTP